MSPCIFEEIDCPIKIVVDYISGCGKTVHTSQHRGIGGSIDNPLHSRHVVYVFLFSDIGMKYFDAECLQSRLIEPAAGAGEVVKAEDCAFGLAFLEPSREATANETADTGDHYRHSGSL